MINKSCRECEDWTEKDIIYTIGVVPKENGGEGKHLASLAFVYGEDYAASAETYERIKKIISTGVNAIPNVEFTATQEIGKVNVLTL